MSDQHDPTSGHGRALLRLVHALRRGMFARVFDLRLAVHDVYQAVGRPLRWLEGLVILAGLGTVVAEYGLQLSAAAVDRIHRWQVFVVWGYVGTVLLRLLLIPHRWAFVQRHKFLGGLFVLLGLDLLVFYTSLGQHWLGIVFHRLDVQRLAVLYVTFIQGCIFLLAVLEGAYASAAIARWQIRPAQTLVLSFMSLMVLGTALLMLPRATTHAGSMSLLQAAFTATSAVCVTGLAVVDTATYFTPFGQGILLGLCQVGGLGILTFATVIGLMVRGDIGIRERVFLHDFVASTHFGHISTTVRRIVGLTLILEAVGAMSLYYQLRALVPEAWPRLGYAVFHAISAFCNAGFSIFHEGLANPGTAMHLGVNVTVLLLIVLGGLGFSVLWEGVTRVPQARGTPRQPLSVQSRLVWITTGLLIVGGTGLFLMLERDGVLVGYTGGTRLLGALFHAVTARTAGFNTLPIETLTAPAAVLLIVLMVIGAAPGSTGGGIKTTTLAVLLLTTLATMRGKARVEVFRRTLPQTVINQAYATFFFAIAMITLSLFVLTMTESHTFLDLFFEEVSAFATVGLSRGITADLSDGGKLIIMLSMFVGRVGSLTLGVALAGQVTTTAYEYPTESVMVG